MTDQAPRGFDRAARRAAALVIALGLDWQLHELPTPVHPVGLVGRAAGALRRHAPRQPGARLRFGMIAPAAVHALAGLGGLAVERVARRLPFVPSVVLEGGALSTTLALRGLLDRAHEVESLLEAGDLEEARAAVARHLVSRDTTALDAAQVAGATIESVAENLSDGVLAPLLAYALGGLPAALAYRSANTFDSLWGYRSPELIDLGRHSARLDDALNLVPSRLSALALVIATLLRRGPWDARRAFDVWVDQGDFTPSPNAGQPMGAMAGALGVELTKPDAYRLGAGWRPPAPEDIRRARGLALVAAVLVAGAVTGLLARGAIGARPTGARP